MTLRELAQAFAKGGKADVEEARVLSLVALEALRAGVTPSLGDLYDPTERAAWIMAARRRDLELAELPGLLALGELGRAAALAARGDEAQDLEVAESVAMAAALTSAIGGGDHGGF